MIFFFNFEKRTKENYERAVEDIDANTPHSKGIKFNSLFNELSFFHVCQPGLPPCFGHEIFEEIMPYIFLFMKHLIEQEKMFSEREGINLLK